MKNPLEARCVFIDGPVAVYVHEAPAHQIRHAYDRLLRLISCMCTELEQAERKALVPLALPQAEKGMGNDC